jgi:hypothetical protein
MCYIHNFLEIYLHLDNVIIVEDNDCFGFCVALLTEIDLSCREV